MEKHEYTLPLMREIDFAFYPRVPQISLELTNRCNLRCPYCANATLSRPKGFIEWQLLEKIVDECADKQYDLAFLHGAGEPLLWDRLEEVIALIKQKRAGRGSFGTNGTLLVRDRVKRLLEAGLDSIYVSIDTLDPKIYAQTRGGKLQRVIRNVQQMIEIVPKTFEITIALMHHKDHPLTQERIDHFYSVFGRHENVKLNPVNNAFFPSARADFRVLPTKREHCLAPPKYLFITWQGKASICCLDQDVLYCLGSVAEQSIQEIWFSARNQTTFRNLALGILDCPSSCTESCILEKPKSDVTNVGLGFALPLADAARCVVELLAKGQNHAAAGILQALVVRDPTNEVLRKNLAGLTEILRTPAQRAVAG